MAEPADVSGHLLTPAQVAAILYVDPKTVTRWAKAGKIDSVLTPGGQRRFLASDVRAVLSGSRQRQPAVVLSEAVVTTAVDLALDAEAEAAAAVAALLVSAASLAAAAEVAAEAAIRARAARALDMAEIARSVAGDAAVCAAAIAAEAEVAATRVVQAAALAASIIIASGTRSDADRASFTSLRVEATLKAAVDEVAQESTAAAASVAHVVALAGVQLAANTRDVDLRPEASCDPVAAHLQKCTVPSPRTSVEMASVTI